RINRRLAELFDVCAGNKCVAGACDDDRLRTRVTICFVDQPVQAAPHIGRRRVNGRIVDDDVSDRAIIDGGNYMHESSRPTIYYSCTGTLASLMTRAHLACSLEMYFPKPSGVSRLGSIPWPRNHSTKFA